MGGGVCVCEGAMGLRLSMFQCFSANYYGVCAILAQEHVLCTTVVSQPSTFYVSIAQWTKSSIQFNANWNERNCSCWVSKQGSFCQKSTHISHCLCIPEGCQIECLQECCKNQRFTCSGQLRKRRHGKGVSASSDHSRRLHNWMPTGMSGIVRVV